MVFRDRNPYTVAPCVVLFMLVHRLLCVINVSRPTKSMLSSKQSLPMFHRILHGPNGVGLDDLTGKLCTALRLARLRFVYFSLMGSGCKVVFPIHVCIGLQGS